MTPLETMLDLLDHGCDGEPRWISLGASDSDDVARLMRLVATEAERRGYLTLSVDQFAAVASALPDGYQHRTFALLQTCRAPAVPDPAILVTAATINPRPHVLVTVTVTPTPAASGSSGRSGSRNDAVALMVREARTMYLPPRRPAPSPVHADSLRHIARAEAAVDVARGGRHERAVRIAREAFAALLRRHDGPAAARVGMLLGRVLLERGRAESAERAFAEAAEAAGRAVPGDAARLRVWLALARTDAGCLTDAEGVLRAIKVAAVLEDGVASAWVDAALARCLLWQNRAGEAMELCDAHHAYPQDADPFLVVHVLATHARVLLAAGRTFDAGQRARAGVEWAERSQDRLLQVVAHTAHVRVLAMLGDADLVAERKARILALAKALHVPLRALRIRVIWADLLLRSGRTREAGQELRRIQRASTAAPRLLRRSVEELGAPRRAAIASIPGPGDGVPLITALLRATQDEDDDRAAARGVLDRVAGACRASRMELQSTAGGALAALVASGSGLPPRLGARAIEAGIIIGPERVEGAWEIAAPVRSGLRLLGAVACRWPLGRDAHPRAAEWLELTSAILAPRVELLLAERSDAARAAVEIPELIGMGAGMTDVRRAIARAASAPFAVLVEGESGAGKELVARAIHHLSARRDRRFCDVNCAALPDELVESELFGHAKGAFTGALVERAGLFEEAHGGTLFLDELPDLSLRAQAKLLRVLQQGEIRRVGETFSRRVDARLVTATNRAMAQEVAEGRFRQDLLYRVDVIRIRIPPLRERPEDVPVLARHFWTVAAERAGTRAVLSHALLGELARYHWPGNVRELQNVISALAVAAPSRGTVRPTLLPPAITGAVSVSSARLQDARRQFERRFIEVALARAGGSRSRAARQLGISRQGLLKLMVRLGLCKDGEESA